MTMQGCGKSLPSSPMCDLRSNERADSLLGNVPEAGPEVFATQPSQNRCPASSRRGRFKKLLAVCGSCFRLTETRGGGAKSSESRTHDRCAAPRNFYGIQIEAVRNQMVRRLWQG
jgi:hypothetical protein